MAFYVKVTKEVADYLGVTAIRNKTADGNVLLWQADLNRIPGDTIFDRAQSVGGVCLQPVQAKAEIDGTNTPAEVYTPEQYKPTEEKEPVVAEEQAPSVEEQTSATEEEEGGDV